MGVNEILREIQEYEEAIAAFTAENAELRERLGMAEEHIRKLISPWAKRKDICCCSWFQDCENAFVFLTPTPPQEDTLSQPKFMPGVELKSNMDPVLPTNPADDPSVCLACCGAPGDHSHSPASTPVKKFKPGHGPTYYCDRCKKDKLFAEDRTRWSNPDDGFRVNQICIDCARELNTSWKPSLPLSGFVEPPTSAPVPPLTIGYLKIDRETGELETFDLNGVKDTPISCSTSAPEPDMVMVRREDLPDADKLLILADWFDSKYPPYNIGSMEVQNDLRRWAKNIKAALAAGKGEPK